jgi:23S rRNA pseudouridine2605 synthase
VQKVLASLGFGSRRACEELIVDGRVRVNGERAHLGRRIDLTADSVEVDGVPVGVRPGLVHYLLNKPVGVVTTATDPLGRRTVVELVPEHPRVFPVGREGVELEDGLTAPASVASVSPGLLRLVIHEGRNRQVRRMCAAVGHPVVRLVRTRVGPLVDRRLPPGQWRELSVAEVRQLAEAAQPAPARGTPRGGR